MLRQLLTTLLLIVFLSNFISAQRNEKIPIDFVISHELDNIEHNPFIKWLNDGSVLIFDKRKAEDDWAFEKISPSTKERTKLFDPEMVLNQLSGKYNLEMSVGDLAGFEDISCGGEGVLYLMNKDVYFLETKSGQIKPITSTGEEESCVKFSPDGTKISYVRMNDLYCYDLIDGKEKRLTFDGTETILNGTVSWVYWEEVFDRENLGYVWSPDSKEISYFQTDESNVSIMHYVDTKPWVPRVIEQRYPKTGEENPKIKVGFVNVENSETVWANLNENEYEYIVRMNWLPDSKRVALQTLNRLQDKLDLYFADLNTGEVEHILTETEKSWVKLHNDLQFLSNDSFIWFSERSGYGHLYLYDMKGNIIKQITSGEWSVVGTGSSGKSVKYVDEKEQKIYFSALKKSSIERHMYEINLDGSGLKRISTNDGSHSYSFNPAGSYYVDDFSDRTTLPRLTLHDKEGEQILTLSETDPKLLEGYELQYPEFFTIPAYDGFELPAYIFKPKNFDPQKKYPLIVFVYGGPSAPSVQNKWHRYTLYFNRLLQEGYLVAGVDNRSATGLNKKVEESVLYRIASTNELKDLVSAVKWWKDKEYIDADRIGIWGWSGGGTFTMNALTNSKEFKAGIAVAGVTDWHLYDTIFGERGMKTEAVNPEGYKETSLLASAKNLNGSLLLVHGTYDDNVHIQNCYLFMEELFKAGKDFDMLIYPMRKHGIADKPARRHLFKKMIQYWNLKL